MPVGLWTPIWVTVPYPVFIDNMESVDELTNVRPTGQIIMAKCVRGAALTVRPMGRPQVQKAA